MKIHILRVIIMFALLEAPSVFGSCGRVKQEESDPDPRRPHRRSSLSGDGIKGIANVDTLRSPCNPEAHLSRSPHLRGARSSMGRVLEDDRKLRADNIFRSVAECDEFCNKPRRACGNRCRARITVCEAQGIKCHPWLCRAFCRGNRSSRYCQNRQIPSDECNRYRKGCSCQNYIGGATEAYDPVSGLTAFFDYSTNEVVVRWDKVQGPKLYDVRITKDNTKVKKLIARGSTKKVEAALFDLDETYDVAVRRKRGKMMGSSPYVSILYKHTVDESQMHKAQDDQVSTTEDHVGDITGNILNNDSDPDFGHTLTVDLHRVSGPPGSRVTYSGDDLSMIITLANGSTLNLRANGNYIFRRASGSYQDLSGTQSEYEEFKYAVDDGHGNSAEAILEVRVDGANDAPIALNDLFVHSSSDPTSIEDVADGCVLENDKDIDIGDVANLAVCVVNGVEIQNDIHQHVDLGQHTKLSIGADGCFTISGLATEYQYLAKGETADVCFFYQACDSHQDISTSYKSNVAEACVRVEGFYEGQDYCLAGNGGCDPLTECENSPGGPVCGPCPSGYSGTGESGCMQNSPCDSFHISVENDAKYTTLLLKGWTNAQVGWEISLSSKATKFELSLPAKDGAEISSLEASVGILESTIADANNTLALPDIRVASGSSCSKDDATLKLTIPSFVSNICFSGGCRPTLCRLPPLPSTLPNYSLVPSNNVKLFGGGHNCTVLQPTFWEEWVEFHFGYSEEFLSEDFYYADPDNDGVMNILEYYGMGEAQLFSDTTDPSGDEDNLCHQDDNDDVIFFGIQSATSYRAGVVELEWTPAFYNSSLEVVEGVFYEIFVATGKFDFSDLGGGLVCPPTISELRQAFQANEKGNFYGHYSTTNTSFVLEGVPPGETISIHAVAVMGSFETSHQYRELTATPTMSSPLRHPTGLVATVASRDPVYASDYQYLEDKNRYIGPLYPSKYCPGFDLDDEDSLEDQGTSMLTLDIIHNIENGTIVFYGEKGANQFEEELWDKIERIVPDDIVSGITGIGTLFQVRIISVNVPGPCSVGTSCYIEVGATSIDIDTIFSELSYNVAYDDVYLNPCHTNYFLQKEAKRNLESDQDSSIEIKKKIFSLNEKYDKKYFGNLVTTRVDFKQSIYFKTEIDFSIFSGIEKARAAAGMDIDLTLTTSFGFDAKFEKKEKRQLWKLKKPIFRYFAINGVYPMWFSITPQLDLEAKVKASAQFNVQNAFHFHYNPEAYVEFDSDKAIGQQLSGDVEDLAKSKPKKKTKQGFHGPSVKEKASLSGSLELKFIIPIEFYKVLKVAPLTVSATLGAKASLDSEVEQITEPTLASHNFDLTKFDLKLALIFYLEGKIAKGETAEADWKLKVGGKEGKELFALESELEEAKIVDSRRCRWDGCDAVIPIGIDLSIPKKDLFFNELAIDDTSEWHFDPNSASKGWELEPITSVANPFQLQPHHWAILRKRNVCADNQVDLPGGNLFFLAKPFVPPFLFSVSGANLDFSTASCPNYDATMEYIPLPSTDPTNDQDTPSFPLTSSSIDDTIPCIAVIDEDTEFVTNNQGIDQESMWDQFREEYPNRPFCLLDIPSTDGEIVNVPENFKSDPHKKYSEDVSRDYGVEEKASDWFELCGLSKYSSVGYVAEFVDNSGSLKIEDVKASLQLFHNRLDALNIGNITVANKKENWIEPFLTTLQGPPCKTLHGSQGGQCISTEKCAALDNNGTPHQSVPWLSGDPTPNCRVYANDIQCCVPNPEPCVTRDGQNGICVHVDDCAGASVPWLEGDPHPNCARYPLDVQCCV